jgi:hypothetical protein
MEPTTNNAPNHMRKWLDTLATKRDELRVQIHLAGMNLEKEWSPIEEKLRALVDVETERDEARLQLHLGKMEAKQELSTMATQLEHIAEQAERVGQDVSRDVKEAVSGLAARLRELVKNHRK